MVHRSSQEDSLQIENKDARLVQSPPDVEELDELQDVIEGLVESGDSAQAVSELQELRVPDKAEVLGEITATSEQVLLGNLTNEEIADVLEHMDVTQAIEVSGLIDIERMAGVLDRVSNDVAADVLRGIDWADAARILYHMEDRSSVGNLLLYQDDDAGGLMSTEFVALRETWTTERSLYELRNSGLDPEDMGQLFAVDDSGVLVGVLELAELVFSPKGTTVRGVMNPDVVSVETGTDQEDAARLMQRYEIRTIPVVDRHGVLEGTIAIEDIVDVFQEEATEDMFRMIGVQGDVRNLDSFRGSFRSRVPWLLVNLGTVLAAGVVLNMFTSTLDSLTILAVYLPVVMGQAGIAGSQTLTIIVRSMALGEINTADARILALKEAVLAFAQGAVVSAVIAGIVLAWQQDLVMAAIVSGALFLNMLIAALSGVAIPFTLKAIKIDPATSSSVFLTTITDIAGIVAYMGLATAFLHLLVD